MKSRFLYLSLAIGLLLASCSPGGQDLGFETIAKSDGGDNLGTAYREEKPALLVIARPEEIGDPAQTVLAEDYRMGGWLRTLDYGRVFAILVLHGYVGSSGYSVTVKEVARQGDQVSVWADFAKPAPDEGRRPAYTSPYHLIAVSREGSWGKDIHFVLMVDGRPVAETVHFVP
jgi:hypothetical protein